MKNLAVIALLVMLSSCAQNKTTIPTDALEETAQNPIKVKTVEGIVTEIQNGKDGYTAKVESLDKEINFVTISISNLKNHEQYKSVKIGDKLKVTGDFWKTETENHITVREIL